MVNVRKSIRTLKAIFICIIVVLHSCTHPSPIREVLSSSIVDFNSIQDEIDQLMEIYVETGNYNGTVLVAQGDQILLNKGYGLYDLEDSIVCRPEDKFELGSIAKIMTATSILILEENGLLGTDDSLNQYLPSFPHASEITLKQLLTHSSGLADYDFSLVFESLDEIIASFDTLKLEYKPGSLSTYCTSDYMLLRKVVENVSGLNHQAFVQKYIFDELGLRSSGYNYDSISVEGLNKGYWNSSAGVIPADSPPKIDQGSLYSTAQDLHQFIGELFKGGLLPQSSRDVMMMEHMPDFSDKDQAWGLGWAIDTLSGERRYWHNGHIHGFCGIISYFPRTEISIVVLSNIQNNSPVEKIAANLTRILSGESYEVPIIKEAIELDPEYMKSIVGRYIFDDEFDIVLSLDKEQLFIQGAGQPKLQLFAGEDNRFFIKEADLEIEIGTDDDDGLRN